MSAGGKPSIGSRGGGGGGGGGGGDSLSDVRRRLGLTTSVFSQSRLRSSLCDLRGERLPASRENSRSSLGSCSSEECRLRGF